MARCAEPDRKPSFKAQCSCGIHLRRTARGKVRRSGRRQDRQHNTADVSQPVEGVDHDQHRSKEARSNPRQTLDVYRPDSGKNLPVVVWVHGGGWRAGDKTEIATKPAAFVHKGLIFISVNYRFVTEVPMETIARDVAKSVRWAHNHAGQYGGDPNRVLLMGHSAGAQLAALLCTDYRYLKAEKLSLAMIKGCVP